MIVQEKVWPVIGRFLAFRTAIPSLLATTTKEVTSLIVISPLSTLGTCDHGNVVG
jgi:hypothetical protein